MQRASELCDGHIRYNQSKVCGGLSDFAGPHRKYTEAVTEWKIFIHSHAQTNVILPGQRILTLELNQEFNQVLK